MFRCNKNKDVDMAENERKTIGNSKNSLKFKK